MNGGGGAGGGGTVGDREVADGGGAGDEIGDHVTPNTARVAAMEKLAMLVK